MPHFRFPLPRPRGLAPWLMTLVLAASGPLLAAPAAPEPVAPASTAAPAVTTPAQFEAALAEQFRLAPPELARYAGLATYGETFSATRRDAASLRVLRALYVDALRLNLLNPPSQQVLDLCHELIVYGTPEGTDCLHQLAQERYNNAAGDYLPVGIFAAGADGEQVATDRLTDPDATARAQWARLLSGIAIYDSSEQPILDALKQERDPVVRDGELHALAHLADPAALSLVTPLLAAPDDATRAGAIFAYTELRGRAGLTVLAMVQPVGPESKRELADGLDFLRHQTTAKSPFGAELKNDTGFLERFGDVKNPVIAWLHAHRAFTRRLAHNPPLKPADKNKLLALLADSKGFGLEAVRGSLLASTGPGDVPALLRIRQSVWISPNAHSEARMHTLDILVRSIRREAAPAAGTQPRRH